MVVVAAKSKAGSTVVAVAATTLVRAAAVVKVGAAAVVMVGAAAVVVAAVVVGARVMDGGGLPGGLSALAHQSGEPNWMAAHDEKKTHRYIKKFIHTCKQTKKNSLSSNNNNHEEQFTM